MEFSIHIASKYDDYGQTPMVFDWLDWMGEALLDLSWIQEWVSQRWMGQAFLDLSWLPDVREWAMDEDNIMYLAENGCLPEI